MTTSILQNIEIIKFHLILHYIFTVYIYLLNLQE